MRDRYIYRLKAGLRSTVKGLEKERAHKKRRQPIMANLLLFLGSPNGDRTRVFGVRGRYPRPLDDGTLNKVVV